MGRRTAATNRGIDDKLHLLYGPSARAGFAERRPPGLNECAVHPSARHGQGLKQRILEPAHDPQRVEDKGLIGAAYV